MGWAWAYLVVTLIGAAFVVNAYLPVRAEWLAVPSFFAGWPTGELPIWHIGWQAVATAFFVSEGVLGHWPGWIGLALSVVSWAGLVVLAVQAARANTVLGRAAEEVPLPAVPEGLDLPASGRATMWRFTRLLYPFPRPARSVRVHRNLDYVGDGIRRHRLDVIVRRVDPPQGAPVLLYIHGGAWVIGDKMQQGLPMLNEFARRGWVTVTINYRLSPRATWPDHLVDCKRALAWVREHIADYGGDPGFIAVSGGSAGGHLASMVALTAADKSLQPGFEDRDVSVDACVPFYGVYDFTGGGENEKYAEGMRDLLGKYVMKRSFAEAPEAYRDASPLFRITPEAPPFFVLHGTNDTLVPVDEARRFVAALRAASPEPVVYAELPLTQHAFDVLPSVRCAHAVAAVVRFAEGVRYRTHHPQ